MSFHPKTSGAAVGGALGTLIVSVLATIHGVHLDAAANGAIPAFLSLVGAWFVPSGPRTVPLPPSPAPPPVSTPPAGGGVSGSTPAG